MRVLLVEDDMLIDNGIKTDPSKMGFSADWFTQGRQGKEALHNAPHDAVILDLALPGMDGRDISRGWRGRDQREPVLILTARDALAEHVEGLRLGADDCLYEPFALIEVTARLETLMRRADGQASNELYHGNVMFDPGERITTLAGEPLTLKPEKLALLKLLMRNVGRVLPCKLIEEKLCTWDEEVTSNAVEMHVHRL